MDTQSQINLKESRILELKHYLAYTDYYDHKKLRGDVVSDSIEENRASAAAEINVLEAELLVLYEQLNQTNYGMD